MAEEELVMEDVNVGELEEFETASLVDVYQFEGKQVPIEKVNIERVLSKYGLDGKQLPPGKEILQPVLKVETTPVFKGKSNKGEEFEIRASELFSLKIKKNETTGKEVIGWSHHEKGSLFKFMKKMRVKHPKELVGKLVLITTRPTDDPDRTFLGFVKE